MKLSFLAFLILVSSISSFAQKIRFSDSTNKWQYFSLALQLEPPIVDSSNLGYTGSVSINDTSYNYFCIPGIGCSIYIREDTLVRKVFVRMYTTTDSSEHVLYDYTLQVNDTFYYPNTVSYYVGSIDSVLINSIWYKVWHLLPSASDTVIGREGLDDYYVIEGIGATTWPLFPTSPTSFESGYVLTCFSNKGATSPLSKTISPCFNNSSSCDLTFGLGISSVVQANSVRVFPDPASAVLNITATQKINTIAITNLVGQVVYRTEFNAQEVQIDVSGLQPGLYFIKINDSDVRKFIKE